MSRGKIKAANFDLNGLWSPWYTLHKTYAGLRDAYRHAGNTTALGVEIKFAEWAARLIEPMADADVQRMLDTEFGGMNEIFADLYADTGDRRWLNLSYRFEHRAVVEPLKRRDDPLDGLHGKHAGAEADRIRRAVRLLTASTHDQVAATFFWDPRGEPSPFVTGGTGKDDSSRARAPEPHRRRPHRGDVQRLQMLKRTRRCLRCSRTSSTGVRRAPRSSTTFSARSIRMTARCATMVPVGRGYRRE